MNKKIISLIFLILILIAVAISPLALFLWEPFEKIGIIHFISVAIALFSIFVVLTNQAIKKYFTESYDYLFIGVILLGGVHITEIIFENILHIEDIMDGKFILFLEHLFFDLGLLAISYSFYKIKEPTIDEQLLEE